MPDQIVGFDKLEVGMDVTAHWANGSGQGGVITAIRWPNVVLTCGTMRYRRIVDLTEIDHWTIEVPYDADECLDYSDECVGPVELRWPGSGEKSWPRCAYHGNRRLARVSELERYADSDVAPSWFHRSWGGQNEDGERWDDDY